MEQFKDIVKKARVQFIDEKVNERLKSALSRPEQVTEKDTPSEEEVTKDTNDRGIETTQEEIDAYNIVKAILRTNVEAERIALRDTKSYCGVLLDDNNRKPLCRFHFNGKQKYLGVLTEKVESRIAINSLDEIFEHSDKLGPVNQIV